MAKKIAIPWELKYKFAMGGWTQLHKGWFYAVREEFGADTALRLYEKIQKMGDRIKNVANTFTKVFNIEGNDMYAIQKFWEIWWEIYGTEGTTVELTKTLLRNRFPMGCAFKTEPKDISDWFLIFVDMIDKAINPKATLERPKAMCAGDSYCEYVVKIKE